MSKTLLHCTESETIGNTYENLFSGKKYTGLDKISKANDITFGLESDFIWSGLFLFYHPLHILF
jgi:lipopolysaccharide assembly outer membrane protein LptD (OstA)